MRIKKYKTNEYLRTPSGVWVRNFTKDSKVFLDLNKMFLDGKQETILHNELENIQMGLSDISSISASASNVLICSDGYKFEENKSFLSNLPNDIAIIGINGSLKKWNIKENRKMDFYLTNNPFEESLSNISKNYFPTCIASSRTCNKFLKFYSKKNSNIYLYSPTPEENFNTSHRSSDYCIDDYRNPVCAGIGLAHQFGARKIFLFCCDDIFEGERPGSERVNDDLWMYPQHQLSHELIDSNLHWMKSNEYQNISIGHNSLGLRYNNSSYIKEDDIEEFFQNE
jgi:hypothetical protein